MKIQNLDQNLKCSTCKTLYPVKSCRRLMNFTFGEITFFCRNCRAKIGFLGFGKWNILHHVAQKKLEEKINFENQRNQELHRRDNRR